jgi:hypothetical protein
MPTAPSLQDFQTDLVNYRLHARSSLVGQVELNTALQRETRDSLFRLAVVQMFAKGWFL